MFDQSKNNNIPEEDHPSKSQRKRDMIALQKMGETLVKLPAAELAKIPLDSRLGEAIKEARTLKTHGAIRRQLQYIGRLMRDTDVKPIEDALAKMALQYQKSNAQFHKIEQWRDKLIQEGDTQLDELIKQFPTLDRQQIRQLIRNAQQQRAGAQTELFRYLREVLNI